MKRIRVIGTSVLLMLTGLFLILINPTSHGQQLNIEREYTIEPFVEMATFGTTEEATTEEPEIATTEKVVVQSPSTTEEATTEEVVCEVVYDDIWYIQCCVETETYGADFDSKTHVASVIMNRVNSDRFPNSAAAVVTAPNQFAYFRTNISQDTIDAVNYVLENGDTAQGGLFFHSGGYSDTFNGAEYVFTDACGHHIYR